MTIAGEKNVEESRQTAEEERARLSRAVEKLVLASIGAVALSQEALEKLLKRLVDRGEQVQEAARKQADALRQRGRHMLEPRMQKVKTALDVDLPSQADILSLQNQLDALSAKVEQLSVDTAQRTTQAQPKESTPRPGQ